MKNIYNKLIYTPLKINFYILGEILLSCTTEIPFYDHHGFIYIQHEGIAIGSALDQLSALSTWLIEKIKFSTI